MFSLSLARVCTLGPKPWAYTFTVSGGDLTIKDTSAAQAGQITGGYNDNNCGGGCIYVDSGILRLESGILTGNKYEDVDANTWKITLRDHVTFTSGRKMDAQAVKECLEDLVAVHERAAGDLKISNIEADGQILTIITSEPVPALMNYLSDPYGCIIDMEAGITDDGNVSGTGPYMATELETDKGLTLVKNENYWNGTPKLDTIYVKTITDGDTMTMALQSGELDAAYGLPYASLPLFANESYTISSCAH